MLSLGENEVLNPVQIRAFNPVYTLRADFSKVVLAKAEKPQNLNFLQNNPDGLT